MKLYLLRHGIAEDHGPDGTDASRELTGEGIDKMRREARGMGRLGVKLDLLLTSPLARARQTAEIVGRELACDVQIADALAPGCNAERLLGLLRQHEEAQRVMVVGHEPDFSTMTSALTGGGHVVVKKGGLARVDLPTLTPGSGALIWLLQPRTLLALEK
jgi:phosphohistidine phosphatase